MPTKTKPSQGAKEAVERIVHILQTVFDLHLGQINQNHLAQIIEDCTLAGELAHSLGQSKNVADEVLKAMMQFVGHAADCMFHRTDSPEGDFCTCRMQPRIRELRDLVKRNMQEAEFVLARLKKGD